MDLNLGSVIKRLRTEQGVTQDALAEYLGISYQAVSKWETGTTLPDITLLPKLAVFFGVRIDELFSVNHEDELERIDGMLQRETMTDQNYGYAKVYLAKSNTDLITAGKMLEQAMELAPLDEEVYGLYRSVRGGSEYKQHSDNDWFIRVCEPYARKYPQNIGLYRMLIEAMISKKYFDRAEELLTAVKFAGENKFMKEVFLGDIALAKGDVAKAKEIWNTVPKTDWLGQYETGERFNCLNEYDKAIECFNHAYEAQTAPRKMDMMYSLAFLYKKLGRFAEAKKEWERIIEGLVSDYGMDEEDNDIVWAKDEFVQLECLLEEK